MATRGENPASKDAVRAWLRARVAADEQMRVALRGRTAQDGRDEDGRDDTESEGGPS